MEFVRIRRIASEFAHVWVEFGALRAASWVSAGVELGRLEGGWGGRAGRVSTCQAGNFAATKVVRAMQQGAN